jgi:hypothetical protein
VSLRDLLASQSPSKPASQPADRSTGLSGILSVTFGSSQPASRTGKPIDPEKAKQAAERAAARKVKQAELKAGGQRADQADWVATYNQPGARARATTKLPPDEQLIQPPELQPCDCPELVCELQVGRQEPKQPPVQPPKPVAERAVSELYVLLAEKVARVVKLNAEEKPKAGARKIALANAQAVYDLLLSKGQSEAELDAFLVADQAGRQFTLGVLQAYEEIAQELGE